MKSVEETWWTSLVCQQEKESVQNTESDLSEVCHKTEWDHSEFTENKNSHELIKIHETKENTDFSRSDELLSMICCKTLAHSRTLDTFYI